KNYYASSGADVGVEPHGSRAADVLGKDKNGSRTVVGEIKKAAEIERDLGGYWSQWNSDQSFGGKTSDFKLAEQYTDKGASLSRNGRGWAAVIDGQLRGYCVKELFGHGDLIVEEFGKYEKDLLETLEYLKKQGRIKGFEIEKVPNSNMARVRIIFDKLPAGVFVPKPKEKIAANTITPEGAVETPKGNKPSKPPKIVPAMEPSRLSTFTQKLIKYSVAIGIIAAGYSAVKEVYDGLHSGEKVHPSRVLARAALGYAGAFCGATVFAVLLSWIPIVGTIIGLIIGGILGSISAEWLFELIMPLHCTTFSILDCFLGGFLGSIFSTLIGIPVGIWKSISDIFNAQGFFAVIGAVLGSVFTCIAVIFWFFFLGGVAGTIFFYYLFF
ncbi:MAG TPA: hypothetical protein PLY41_05560, partial [Acetomicrobium sp.]|nr:hypothetical protein [Acetomicrobium sp.]